MQDIFSWLKKHLFLTIIMGIIAIWGIPLIIHVIFKMEAPNYFWIAEWSAGDMLQYYASVLTFISTTILSVAALQVTLKTSEEEEKRIRKSVLGVQEGSLLEMQSIGEHFEMKMNFKNYGDSFPEKARLKKLELYSNTGNIKRKKYCLECQNNSMCSIRGIQYDSFDVIISVFKGGEKVNDISVLQPLKKDYQDGLVAKEDAEQQGYSAIRLEIDFYSGNVFTPVCAMLYLKWNVETQSSSFSNISYTIVNSSILLQRPMIEKYKSVL